MLTTPIEDHVNQASLASSQAAQDDAVLWRQSGQYMIGLHTPGRGVLLAHGSPYRWIAADGEGHVQEMPTVMA